MSCRGVLWVLGLWAFAAAGIQTMDAAVKAQLLRTGFSRPVFVTAPPGDTNRLFVVEQHLGRIRILDLATTNITGTFLQVGVRTGNEQGLLGLAFHPDYSTNGYFYINLTPSGGVNRTEIRRYTAEGDPATAAIADTNSMELILSFNQPESNHNGGWIGFGLDGYLYISSGDGGGGNDQHGSIGNGQSLTTLLGKILRIDVDGGDPYAIPADNPFAGHATSSEEIWAFGLRNPWRCSIDSQTGNLWIGDVGQGAREEIDVAPAGVGGLNFGWRPREGTIATPGISETPVTDAVDPVFDYPRSFGFSVTGGYMYRGEKVPEMRDKYIFADFGSARFWLLTPDATGTNGTAAEITSEIRGSTGINEISSFGRDSSGELYICDLGGQVYRIISDAPPATNPRITAVEFSGETQELIVQFNAAAGQEYVLEGRESLDASSSWSTAQEIQSSPTPEVVTLELPVTGAARYFRLREQ